MFRAIIRLYFNVWNYSLPFETNPQTTQRHLFQIFTQPKNIPTMSVNIDTANTNINRTVLPKKLLIIRVQYSDGCSGAETILRVVQSYF
jgi:hypothetical protein